MQINEKDVREFFNAAYCFLGQRFKEYLEAAPITQIIKIGLDQIEEIDIRLAWYTKKMGGQLIYGDQSFEILKSEKAKEIIEEIEKQEEKNKQQEEQENK